MQSYRTVAVLRKAAAHGADRNVPLTLTWRGLNQVIKAKC